MSTLIKIINPTAPGPAVQRIRMWQPVGIPAALGRGICATLYSDRHGEDYRPCLEIATRLRVPQRHEFAPAVWLDLTEYCGALLMPRAAALDEAGHVTRYFVEYAIVDRTRLFQVRAY